MNGIALTALVVLGGMLEAAPQTEPEKIEALIRHVEGLVDAKFVRNGVEYDAKTAGQFLRGKWKAQESSIKTAKDFIEQVASQSSTTGKPYLIKLPNKEWKSSEYLAAELKKLEMGEQLPK
jgi:Family of unknown function (DUF5329)